MDKNALNKLQGIKHGTYLVEHSLPRRYEIYHTGFVRYLRRKTHNEAPSLGLRMTGRLYGSHTNTKRKTHVALDKTNVRRVLQ